MDYRVLAVLFASLLYAIVWIVNAFAPWRSEVGEWSVGVSGVSVGVSEWSLV